MKDIVSRVLEKATGSLLYIYLANWHIVLLEYLWRYQGHFMTQIRITVLVTGRKILIGHLLQPATVFGWHHVPRLGCSKVQIIDRVQVHVLCVPGKRCLPHAKVQVCGINAINLYIIILVDKVQYATQTIDVPALQTRNV